MYRCLSKLTSSSSRALIRSSNTYLRMSSTLLPALPNKALSGLGETLQKKMLVDLQSFEAEIQAEEGQKEGFFKLNRIITVASHEMLQLVRNGDVDRMDTLIEENRNNILQVLDMINQDPCQRESRLSYTIERFSVPRLLLHFYRTGKLASQGQLSPANDEEYVGAVIGFAQELSRYAVNRACVGDASSIELCRLIVVQINQALLAFDFRNGPLRRKFDGLKYALKSIEDVAFELSLQDECSQNALFTEDGPAAKRAKSESSPMDSGEDCKATVAIDNVVDAAEFQQICQRMNEYDQLRENVIKDSRDVQKLSKQAIFSVVRGQTGEAQNKLDQAKKMAEKIFLTVNKYPTLRPGAFSNSLEEWAEGMMLIHWVNHHTVPSRSDLQMLSTGEFIGGLSDFTGEVGRIAVMLAAKRDIDGVREIQQVDIVVADFISRLNIANRYGKKLEATNTNLRKLEDIVYELSMLQRSGRSKRMKVGADLSEGNQKGDDKDQDNE